MNKGERKGNVIYTRPDGVVQVKLTQGTVSLVDPDDWEKIRHHTWFGWRRVSSCYARTTVRTGKQTKTLLMHRLILEAPSNSEVDHINGNGLDNRRQNLRLATRGQNCANVKGRPGTSQYKGVSWDTLANKWKAQIQARGHRTHIGLYRVELEAAQAYDQAAIQNFGTFARINGV